MLETMRTGLGPVDALHLVRLPPPDAKGRRSTSDRRRSTSGTRLRVRFTDSDEYVDQTLDKIVRK